MNQLILNVLDGLLPDLRTASLLIPTLSPFILVSAGILHQRCLGRNSSPLSSEKLLRPAGYSEILKMDTHFESMFFNLLGAAVMCLIAASSAAATGILFGGSAPVAWTGFTGSLLFFSFVPGVALTLRAFQKSRALEKSRLRVRGEQAVAEVLDDLGHVGFRTFHDLQPKGSWNIDHIIVGPSGVFAIETKACQRPSRQKAYPTVRYDGQTLEFPSESDSQPVVQVQRNAHWLTDYLSKMTEETVQVHPVVVIPGWRVDSAGDHPVKVTNTHELVKFLRDQPEKLNQLQIHRIAVALDEKCRNLAL